MEVRKPADPEYVNHNVCQLAFTDSAVKVSIGSQRLATLQPKITHTILVGDTGCRQKENSPIQNCSDPNAWGAKLVSDSMSVGSAGHSVVVHVGDYVVSNFYLQLLFLKLGFKVSRKVHVRILSLAKRLEVSDLRSRFF